MSEVIAFALNNDACRRSLGIEYWRHKGVHTRGSSKVTMFAKGDQRTAVWYIALRMAGPYF